MEKKTILFVALIVFNNLGGQDSIHIRRALVFGHRGASFHAPENTLAAIKKAFSLDADGVEVDIRMTADKKIIVMHDETLKRVATYTSELAEKTGMSKETFERIINTPVDQLHYADIQHINIGLWNGEQWTEETTPTLSEVLDIILLPPQKEKKIQVEIKEDNITVIQELKKVLHKYPQKAVSESIIFIGFDLEMMQRIKKTIPYCAALYIRYQKQVPTIGDIHQSINQTIHAGLDGIDFEANPSLVTKDIIDTVHQKEKAIGIWVYPEQDTCQNLQYFKDLGVDFITTNLPPEVVTELIVAKLKSYLNLLQETI